MGALSCAESLHCFFSFVPPPQRDVLVFLPRLAQEDDDVDSGHNRIPDTPMSLAVPSVSAAAAGAGGGGSTAGASDAGATGADGAGCAACADKNERIEKLHRKVSTSLVLLARSFCVLVVVLVANVAWRQTAARVMESLCATHMRGCLCSVRHAMRNVCGCGKCVCSNILDETT